MAQTDKLVRYIPAAFPTLPGGDKQFLQKEFRHLQLAIRSIETIMAAVEKSPQVQTKAGAVTAADVPEGTWRVIEDTTGGTVGLYANVGGTLKKVLLT